MLIILDGYISITILEDNGIFYKKLNIYIVISRLLLIIICALII